MPPLPPPVEEKREARVQQNPSPPPSLPSSSIPNGHANPSERVVSPPPPPQAPDSDDSNSDAASISSYETGHEVFRDDPVFETNISQLSPPPPKKPSPPPLSNPNGLLPLPDHNPRGNMSDLSASTASTEVVNQNLAQAQAQAQAQSGTSTPDSGSQPRRRKSVRVSLQPTFSPTPPAIEDDEPPPWETSWKSDSYKSTRDAGDGVHDVWDDSSSEDAEYSRARSLLSKLSRKDKKGS
ncbi:hypothetical protein MPER_06000 [Moniliophthora perniciosa FA553]|nr:hypothetical protein MPER_06000 [Moniliophthora perniciosa FA553]